MKKLLPRRSAGRVAPSVNIDSSKEKKVMGLDAGSESRPITATFEYNVSDLLLIALS
jgi:hypothetical protein